MRQEPVIVKVLHDEFREPFLEIYAGSGDSKRLVTSIEVLSLSNKTPGEQGRELFLRKQRELLASKVNLVEIDLLRKGYHSTAVPLEPALAACGPFDYHVSVHPFDDVETYYVYPMNLKEPLATIEVPLLPGDAAISLDLQAVFDRCYDAGPYAREIDYSESQIIPALTPIKRPGLQRSSGIDEIESTWIFVIPGGQGHWCGHDASCFTRLREEGLAGAGLAGCGGALAVLGLLCLLPPVLPRLSSPW